MKRLTSLVFEYFCLNKKFLTYNLVIRNIKVKYRRSYLGFFWTVLSPLSTAAVYYFVFKMILNVTIPNYLAFILVGILPWSFFSQTILESMDGIVGNVGLLSKVPVPIQVFAFSGSLSNAYTFLLSLPILAIASYIDGNGLTWWFLMVLPYSILLFLISYALGLSFGIIYAYFRDFKHIVSIVIQLWFYGTPVIYSEKMIPERFLWLLDLNPVGHIFVGLHKSVVEGIAPSFENLWIPILWTLGLTATTLCIVQRSKGDLVEIL